jgi:hypothetical protein
MARTSRDHQIYVTWVVFLLKTAEPGRCQCENKEGQGNVSIQTKLWLSTAIQKDTKIRIFNASVKSVLLYGCETWLVTSEIQRKIQTFVN